MLRHERLSEFRKDSREMGLDVVLCDTSEVNEPKMIDSRRRRLHGNTQRDQRHCLADVDQIIIGLYMLQAHSEIRHYV